jgi:hypothetical protein
MYKKMLAAVLIATLSLSGLFASGGMENQGLPLEEVQNLTGFTKIINDAPIDLHIRISDEHSIQVIGSRGLKNSIRFSRTGDVLRIGLRPRGFIRFLNPQAKLEVTLPVLEGIYTSNRGMTEIADTIRGNELTLATTGLGRIRASAEVETLSMILTGPGSLDIQGRAENIELRSTGVGTVSADIEGDTLALISTGAGSVTLRGSARWAELRHTGAGSVDALGLEIEEMDARVTGVGTSKINVAESLSAILTGAGDLEFAGDARIESLITSGSGQLIPIRE